MKRLFFLLLIGLVPMISNAQRVDKPNESYHVYCKITVYTVEVSIDILDEHTFILNDEEKKIKFQSATDALTYMSKRGWEFVDFLGEGKYILKKEVKSDEEARNGLKLGNGKKKKD